jgi:uncharacterized protein YbjT (DUF2867 family)
MEQTTLRILVLGASGYIGQRLVPQLVAEGHQVIAAARNVSWLEDQHWENVQCHQVDLLKNGSLKPLLHQCDIVYYLVHSMGDGADFIQREARCARHLRDELKQYPVRHLIFVSALQPREPDTRSGHMLARYQTAQILGEAGVPLTELRAGIIVGAGSAAFEVMRDMVYNLPLLTPPRWVRSHTSPIALNDLLYYLVRLAFYSPDGHQVFEAAGPEVLSYQEQFHRFMAISGVHRPLVAIPLPVRWISVWFLHLITSVPPATAQALIQGIAHDLLPDASQLQQLFPRKLTTFDDAVRKTLEEEQHLAHPSDWGFDEYAHARWQPEYGYFPKQAGHTQSTTASATALWQVINQVGGKEGFFFGGPLWATRALIDRLLGHPLPKGRPGRLWLKKGDKVDSWKVLIADPEKQLSLLFGMKAPGLGRLCFTLRDKGDYREVDIRAWWHPHGFSGLLYWLVMIPAHLFIFRGMVRRVIQLAEQSGKKTSD